MVEITVTLFTYFFIILFAVTMVAILIAFLARPEKGANLLDIREVDGVPVLWENGMPYFTWMKNTDHEQLDLSSVWKFRLDPDDIGREERWFEVEFDDSDWYDHPVPGTWNIQKPEWLDYVGVGWYRRKFTVPASMTGKFNRIVLDGVAFVGHAYLNGKFIGSHSGGYTQWSLDITDSLFYDKENTLAVRIDTGRDYYMLPPLTGPGYCLNWWFYGGIKRIVKIDSGPCVTFCKLLVNTDHKGKIEGSVIVYNRKQKSVEADVGIRLLDLSGGLIKEIVASHKQIDRKDLGAVKFEDIIKDIKLWSPDTPDNRYILEVNVATIEGAETQSIEIGFRHFEFKGTSAYLNGEKIFLRGMNRHEDDSRFGPIQTAELIEQDMELFRNLHVNFMRPGHYPNDISWILACNREGIMVVHENPLYQLGHSFHSVCSTMRKEVCKEATRQLIEMIERDRNHPSVVMWSVGNENVPFIPSIRKILKKLCAVSRRFDPVRPITLATMHIPYGVIPRLDFSAALGDVLFINEYCGWYSDKPEDVGPYLDSIHKKWPDKPVVVSEFGAGSVKGREHGELIDVGMGSKRDFSENYQKNFYKIQLEQILKRPFVIGTMPWVFADFRDDKRPNNPIPNMNLKGLVTYDREPKKAYHVFAETYAQLEKQIIINGVRSSNLT